MPNPARIPNTAHTSRPWRIHELTPDFELEDVWALPTPGGPDDFHLLVERFASMNPSRSASWPVRALFAIRWKVGELLGWDAPDTGVGSRVATLRDRLPPELRDAESGPDLDHVPFTQLYLLEDEWAAETANRTVHGVVHLGWVPDGAGRYRGQMAVLVKRNARLGTAYMAAIRPFRHLVVYPALIKWVERTWGAGERWVVLYDADCGFCKRLLASLLRWDRSARLNPVPLQEQEAGELLADLAPAERMASWHLISPAGARYSGGAAVGPLLRLLPDGRIPAAAVERFPRLTDRTYRWVAEHRSLLSRWVLPILPRSSRPGTPP